MLHYLPKSWFVPSMIQDAIVVGFVLATLIYVLMKLTPNEERGKGNDVR